MRMGRAIGLAPRTVASMAGRLNRAGLLFVDGDPNPTPVFPFKSLFKNPTLDGLSVAVSVVAEDYAPAYRSDPRLQP